MTFRYVSALLGALAAACLAAPAAAQAPPDVLDDLWFTVCAQAGAGTAFRARCDEILDAGPGGAGRRSGAAIGNNLGVASAQGRASTMSARIAAESVDRRLEDVKDDQPGGGGSVEWATGRLSLFFSGDFGRSDREQSDF